MQNSNRINYWNSKHLCDYRPNKKLDKIIS